MDGSSQNEDDFIRQLTAGQTKLRSLVLGLAPTRSDADDVLQEVNLALWRKRHAFDVERDFLSWACGFVLQEIRNFRKKSARDRLWFSDSTLELLTEAWPACDSSEGDRRDALAFCIKKLGSVEYEYIAQYYGKRLSGPEIAESSARPVSTVYKVLARARQSLRACVERTLAQEHRGYST